jgi:hypothetical protein
MIVCLLVRGSDYAASNIFLYPDMEQTNKAGSRFMGNKPDDDVTHKPTRPRDYPLRNRVNHDGNTNDNKGTVHADYNHKCGE